MQKSLETFKDLDPIFRIGDQVSLVSRQWDEEIVFFDINTGDTVLLDESAAFVLFEIEKAPRSIRQLECIIHDLVGLPDDQASDYLDRLISELLRLGLLEHETISE